MFLTNQFLSFYSTFSFFLYLRDFLVDQNGALVLCVEVTENYLFDLSEKVNYNFLQLLSFVIQIKFFSFQNFIERLFRHTSRIKNCIHFWTVFIALITTNWWGKGTGGTNVYFERNIWLMFPFTLFYLFCNWTESKSLKI